MINIFKEIKFYRERSKKIREARRLLVKAKAIAGDESKAEEWKATMLEASELLKEATDMF